MLSKVRLCHSLVKVLSRLYWNPTFNNDICCLTLSNVSFKMSSYAEDTVTVNDGNERFLNYVFAVNLVFSRFWITFERW